MIKSAAFFFCIYPAGAQAGFYIYTAAQEQKNERKSRGLQRPKKRFAAEQFMAFFNSAVGVLQTLVIALGAGLGIWGAINLLEGYGNDNPGAKSQGMKQLMAGGGVALIGITLVPLLSGLFG